MVDIDPDERPVHTEMNVTTGAVTHTPVTDQEWNELRQRAADAAAEQASQDRQRQDLAQQVADHPDPLVRLLAERAGLS